MSRPARPPFDSEIHQVLARMRQIDDHVMRESVRRTVEVAQAPGSIPIDTGFMRASLQGEQGQPVAAAIAAWDLKSSLRLVYQATYARFVHWGTSQRRGRPWVTLAAQQFPQISAQVRREAVAAADASTRRVG